MNPNERSEQSDKAHQLATEAKIVAELADQVGLVPAVEHLKGIFNRLGIEGSEPTQVAEVPKVKKVVDVFVSGLSRVRSTIQNKQSK